MLALLAAITIIRAYSMDSTVMEIMTLQHDAARTERNIQDQLDGLNRAERNIAQLVEEVIGLRGEVKRLQVLETEVKELRALVAARRAPEPGVLYELPSGHEREATVTVTTGGDAQSETHLATTRAAAPGS